MVEKKKKKKITNNKQEMSKVMRSYDFDRGNYQLVEDTDRSGGWQKRKRIDNWFTLPVGLLVGMMRLVIVPRMY